MGGYPIALKLLPGDRYAVVTDDAEDDQALRVVDLKAADPLHAVVSEVTYPIRRRRQAHAGPALRARAHQGWIAAVRVERRLRSVARLGAAAMHYNTVQVFDVAGTPPTLTKNDALELKL